MTKQLKSTLHLDSNYIDFLNGVKDRLRTVQLRAVRAVNNELVSFYWELGKELIEKQKAFKWGEHFLDQVSHDMRAAFPQMQGFSKTNLVRMRKFASLYPDDTIGAQAVHQLLWGHIVVLIQRVKVDKHREWYAQQALKNGWSRPTLEMQIESQLYERQGVTEQKISNFHVQLPKHQSGLAHEMLKDPYSFDFLTIQGEAHERAVENGLIAHIRDFLIELGQGFAFVGSTIGLLLCKSKSKIIAEYALSTINVPIGISEYELSKAIPKELKTSLPTIEELEAELNREIQPEISKGIYKHYKGNQYEVTGTAQHSETKEEFVVYRALYGDYGLWIRPAEMFAEEVLIEGTAVPRFQLLENET